MGGKQEGLRDKYHSKTFLGFFFCCYCKTTEQDQLKERKGLFWLGLPERCDPSWWETDDHDQGRSDGRKRKLGGHIAFTIRVHGGNGKLNKSGTSGPTGRDSLLQSRIYFLRVHHLPVQNHSCEPNV